MNLKENDLFAQHPRSWQDNRYVYAVISRRSGGLSVGVELNPDKVCNFDCVYCCVDRTVPAMVRQVDLEVLADELDRMLGLVASGEIYGVEPLDKTPLPLRRLNDVAFSGSGEPTSCAKFGEACRVAAELLAKHKLTGAKIVVITNGTLLNRPGVVRAMEYLDGHNGEVWAKLDAGTEEYYGLVERTRVPFRRVIENIAGAGRVRPIVIQSLFMKLRGTPPTEAEIEAYVGRLRELMEKGCRIKLVQVYTVARKPAEGFVTTVEECFLEGIAGKVRGLGVAAEVYA
ncbi:MAG: radical SAM protein [Planctomycetota bacterium]|nr:radical SAM protein [Planctomycetota bacterium]